MCKKSVIICNLINRHNIFITEHSCPVPNLVLILPFVCLLYNSEDCREMLPTQSCRKEYPKKTTESQNAWTWNGPVEITLSKAPAEAGSPRAVCTRSQPGGFE